MNKLAKLKFFIGIVLTIAIVFVFGAYLDYSLSQKNSFEAAIASDSFLVGSFYSGTITEISVEEGDVVSEGQTLATLQSPDIAEAIENDRITDTSAYKITDDRTIALLASRPGTVNQILYEKGSFVSSSDTIMSLEEISDPYVEALFKLLPPDYDRVTTGTKIVVTLPNNDTFEATVSDIAIQRSQDDDDNEGIDTFITAIPDGSVIEQRKFPVGTPVRVLMLLQDDQSFYDSIRGRVTSVFASN